MSSPLDKIKPNVRAIAAYTLAPLEAPIKVNQNENPFGMPREIKEEVMRRVMRRDWARYPEFTPTSLLKKLAKYAGWREDGVMAGNGGEQDRHVQSRPVRHLFAEQPDRLRDRRARPGDDCAQQRRDRRRRSGLSGDRGRRFRPAAQGIQESG